MVWYSHLFQNFPQFVVIHTVKGFGIVNKAEVDVFLQLSCLSTWMQSQKQQNDLCSFPRQTINFQIFKLDLEKAEEPDIKLLTSAGSWKKEESSRKNIYFCFFDYAKAFDCVDHNELWKILKKMGMPDYLTCLLRNLYAGQEATVRAGHGTTDWFQIGKGVCQGCILSPCLFSIYEEYIM